VKAAGSVSGRPGLIIAVARRKYREIELVIDEVAEDVFKGAAKNLLLKRNRDELRLFVGVIFVSRQRCASPRSNPTVILKAYRGFSEAYDTYGPEEEYPDHMGMLPDDDFWQIVEHMDAPDSLEGEVGEERLDEVLRQVRLTDEDLDKLVASGEIAAEDREKVKEEASEQTKKFFNRATGICWQLSSGKFRCENAVESRVVFEAFSLFDIDPDDMEDVIYLPIEGYHRTVMIRKHEVQYISIPKHMYREGSTDSAEEELDTP
jgi:hypothetical protein